MNYPAALVVAVLVWSSARYLPPYFLELRKVQMEEQRVEVEHAKQLAVLKAMRPQPANVGPQAQVPSEMASPNRFF